MPAVHPLRLVAKALLLFALSNILVAIWDPPVGKLSVFNHLLPGRLRFNAERNSDDPSSAGILTFDDLDAMFASHTISNGPKPAGEYRVVLLGDSAVWGFEVRPEDILSQQISRLGLQTCDGRQIRAYDLAYPLPSNTRDLVTLQKALEFQPDLVIWLVTLKTFESTGAERYLLVPQSDRVLGLIATYKLRVDAERFLRPRTLTDRSLVGSAVRLKKIALEQLYGFLLAATALDVNLPANVVHPADDVSAATNYNAYPETARAQFIAQLDFLPVSAAQQIAGRAPLLLVNEPIFEARGANSSLRYNKYYPRWTYDAYRERLADFMRTNGGAYLDLWDALPNDEFVGSPLHLNPQGERALAGELVAQVLSLACRPHSTTLIGESR
jgi:hypothetical protein